MGKKPLEIHSENILPIIKRWLYSDKDIFVRELVSNSSDAIQKVKILRDQGALQAQDEEFRIEVKIDKTARTLTFSDNGVGMDEEEVQKYIAQIAFSGAEDFDKIMKFYDVNAHQNVRKRDVELLKTLISEGSVTLIEDAKGHIAASSICYPHKVTDKDGIERVKWQEFGSTRIVKNGFDGMLDVMMGAQIMRSFLVEAPEDRFVAQMHYRAIQQKAEAMGLREYHNVDEALNIAKLKTVDINDLKHASTDHWYQLGVEGMPILAGRMIEFLDKPYMENLKTGEKIKLDFSKTKIFGMFEDNIRKLAAADFGDVEKPDFGKSISKHHRQWVHKTYR